MYRLYFYLLLLTYCCGFYINDSSDVERNDYDENNPNLSIRRNESEGVLCLQKYEGKCDNDEIFEIEYIAAVLEYEAYNDLADGGLALLRENAKSFIEYAALAKEEGADIIVFPEYGLTSTLLGGTFDVFLSQTQLVPDVKDGIIPCYYSDINNYTKVIQVLSCGAAELGMYFVVNLAEQEPCSGAIKNWEVESTDETEYKTPQVIDDTDIKIHSARDNDTAERFQQDEAISECPESGYVFYNTQVVFDRTGMVIASYRKKHLFLEPQFTPGNQPDKEAVFTTDFGVSFALQVCFDIMYEAPAGHNIDQLDIHDVAMSTAWIDELPFLTAPQIWKGWSEGQRVNLLVSNYHNPIKGELGSGIFRGYTSDVETYTYEAESGTTLIVGKVKSMPAIMTPKRTKTLDEMDEGGTIVPMRPLQDTEQLSSQNRINYVRHTESAGEVTNSTNTQQHNVTSKRIGENQAFIHEDLSNYNSSTLERTDLGFLHTKTLCHDDGFCCNLNYSYSFNETEIGSYKLFAYSGIVEKGGGVYAMYTQTCAVVYCLNEETTSCARVEGQEPTKSNLRVYELDGNFASPKVYPSVLTQYLKLQDSSTWTFNLSQYPDYYYGSLNCLEKVENLLSVTLFSRWYSMDPTQDDA